MKDEKMDLAEALRILGWTPRDRISRATLEQACSVVLDSLRDMVFSEGRRRERKREIEDDRCDIDDYNDEIIQRIIISFWDRQEPLSSTPPPNVPSARSYLKRTVRNARISMARKQASETSRQRALAREQTTGNRWRGSVRTEQQEPSLRESAYEKGYKIFWDGTEKSDQESVVDDDDESLAMQLGEEVEESPDGEFQEVVDPAAKDTRATSSDVAASREGEPSLVGMLDVLEKRLERVAQSALENRDWQELLETWVHFRQAVLETARQARTEEARRTWVETFACLVRCALEQTTMHQEVLRECGRGGSLDKTSAEYRTVRNRLDQRKSRFLSRVMERMVARGASREAAARMVKAFASKGSGDAEPRGGCQTEMR